jgi:hypothetical protein
MVVVISDTHPNSLINSTVSPNVKTAKEGVGVRFLVHSTSGMRRAYWSFGMGARVNDKQVNYSHRCAQTKQQVG